MELSWSEKLFLKVNAEVGKRKWLDWFMIFCARWLIFVMGAIVAAFTYWFQQQMGDFSWVGYVKIMFMLGVYLLIPIIGNWIYAYFKRHSRPIVKFPQSKQLCGTFQTWKSFPSDHTTLAWSMALLPFVFGLLEYIFHFFAAAVLGIICASLVSIARVYVGVHYPRDIIGGYFVAVGYSILAFVLITLYAMSLFYDQVFVS